MKPNWRRNYLRYRSFFLNVMSQYKKRADLKVYLEIFLSLITISIFSIFALRPTLLTIAQLIKEIDTKKQTVAKMDTKIQNLTTAQSLYDRERDKIRLLQSAVPDKPNPDIFSRQIEGLSGKYQTGILGITINKVLIVGQNSSAAPVDKTKQPLPEGAEDIAFSVSAVTSVNNFTTLKDFLSEFEKLRSPFLLDRMNFNLKEERDKEPLLILSVEGRLPFAKNTEASSIP